VNRKGISYQLSIYIVSATIIVVGVMVYLNYNFSKHILRQKIEESAVNQSNIVISRVTRYTATAQEISRNVAAQVLYYHKNGDLEMFLANVLKNNPIINTIHVDLSPEYFKNTDLSYHACVEKQGVCCGSVAAGLRQQQFPQSVPEHGVWSGTFYCKCDSTNCCVHIRIQFISPIRMFYAGLFLLKFGDDARSDRVGNKDRRPGLFICDR
jgi:sigma-B regulation protein RsbU (phosphoserine phosphatase)